MKKIIAVLAFMGMCLDYAGSADAAVLASYAGSVKTVTHAKTHRIHHGRKPQVKVRAKSGMANPRGKVTTFCRKGNTKVTRHVTSTVRRDGTAPGPKLKPRGVWHCTSRFNGTGVFHDSRTSFTVRVR